MTFDTLLIDSDILLYQTAFACERECRWDDDTITLHTDANELLSALDRAIDALVGTLGGTPVLCMTSPNNFRKALYPDYKANRTARKPLGFRLAREHLQQSYKTYERDGLEADDCLGILGTLPATKNPIIVSGDKDLDQIPGRHANMAGDVYEVSPEQGQAFFWTQCLTGDSTDNYPGCPGIGPKTAQKILEGSEYPWPKIVASYQKKGLSEAYALTQARLAKILTYQDYDFTKKEPILWTPN